MLGKNHNILKGLQLSSAWYIYIRMCHVPCVFIFSGMTRDIATLAVLHKDIYRYWPELIDYSLLYQLTI